MKLKLKFLWVLIFVAFYDFVLGFGAYEMYTNGFNLRLAIIMAFALCIGLREVFVAREIFKEILKQKRQEKRDDLEESEYFLYDDEEGEYL